MILSLAVFIEEVVDEWAVEEESYGVVGEVEEIVVVEQGIMVMRVDRTMVILIWIVVALEVQGAGEAGDAEEEMAMAISIWMAVEFGVEVGEAEDVDQQTEMEILIWMVMIVEGEVGEVEEEDEAEEKIKVLDVQEAAEAEGEEIAEEMAMATSRWVMVTVVEEVLSTAV